MSTEDTTIQYRVEVQMETGKWVQFNSTTHSDKEAALERLAEVRSYYTDKTIGVRLTAAPVLEWTPVPVPLDDAVARLSALLDPNTDGWIVKTDGKVHAVKVKVDDLRLVLDTLKEAQK